MGAKIVTRKELDAWVAALVHAGRVVGVEAKGDKFCYGDLHKAEDLRLDYDVTILPPKQYFLPTDETL
ncbi:MAG: Ni/Fe hydrogenase subunit beta, partial [Spirochaetaceae bacterium]